MLFKAKGGIFCVSCKVTLNEMKGLEYERMAHRELCNELMCTRKPEEPKEHGMYANCILEGRKMYFYLIIHYIGLKSTLKKRCKVYFADFLQQSQKALAQDPSGEVVRWKYFAQEGVQM